MGLQTVLTGKVCCLSVLFFFLSSFHLRKAGVLFTAVWVESEPAWGVVGPMLGGPVRVFPTLGNGNSIE